MNTFIAYLSIAVLLLQACSSGKTAHTTAGMGGGSAQRLGTSASTTHNPSTSNGVAYSTGGALAGKGNDAHVLRHNTAHNAHSGQYTKCGTADSRSKHKSIDAIQYRR